MLTAGEYSCTDEDFCIALTFELGSSPPKSSSRRFNQIVGSASGPGGRIGRLLLSVVLLPLTTDGLLLYVLCILKGEEDSDMITGTVVFADVLFPEATPTTTGLLLVGASAALEPDWNTWSRAFRDDEASTRGKVLVLVSGARCWLICWIVGIGGRPWAWRMDDKNSCGVYWLVDGLTWGINAS